MSEVYFIRPVGMDGPVKIGFSHNVNARLNVLQQASPFLLEVAATAPGGKEVERRFHAMFYSSHSHGEWFHASPALSASITALNGGSFNFDAMPPPLYLAKPSREFLEWSLCRPAKQDAAA